MCCRGADCVAWSRSDKRIKGNLKRLNKLPPMSSEYSCMKTLVRDGYPYAKRKMTVVRRMAPRKRFSYFSECIRNFVRCRRSVVDSGLGFRSAYFVLLSHRESPVAQPSLPHLADWGERRHTDSRRHIGRMLCFHRMQRRAVGRRTCQIGRQCYIATRHLRVHDAHQRDCWRLKGPLRPALRRLV